MGEGGEALTPFDPNGVYLEKGAICLTGRSAAPCPRTGVLAAAWEGRRDAPDRGSRLWRRAWLQRQVQGLGQGAVHGQCFGG